MWNCQPLFKPLSICLGLNTVDFCFWLKPKLWFDSAKCATWNLLGSSGADRGGWPIRQCSQRPKAPRPAVYATKSGKIHSVVFIYLTLLNQVGTIEIKNTFSKRKTWLQGVYWQLTKQTKHLVHVKQPHKMFFKTTGLMPRHNGNLHRWASKEH